MILTIDDAFDKLKAMLNTNNARNAVLSYNVPCYNVTFKLENDDLLKLNYSIDNYNEDIMMSDRRQSDYYFKIQRFENKFSIIAVKQNQENLLLYSGYRATYLDHMIASALESNYKASKIYYKSFSKDIVAKRMFIFFNHESDIALGKTNPDHESEYKKMLQEIDDEREAEYEMHKNQHIYEVLKFLKDLDKISAIKYNLI